LLWGFVAAVEEAVFKLVVSVQITKERYSSLSLCRLRHVLFQKVYLRMNIGHWIAPTPIEVNTSQR
jgi:hypothetical protein